MFRFKNALELLGLYFLVAQPAMGQGPREVQRDRIEQILGQGALSTEMRSIGDIGSAANAQGPLATSDFPNAGNVAGWAFEGDATQNIGSAAPGALSTTGTPRFDFKGFFGRQSLPDLDGVGQDFNSSSEFFDPGDNDHSFGGWFYNVDWSGNNQGLISQRGTDNSFHLFMNAGNVEWRTYSNNSTFTNCTYSSARKPLSPGWHHIVATYRDNTPGPRQKLLYIDGDLHNDTCGTSAMQQNSGNNFTIGSINSVSDFAPIKFQDVFFVNGDVLTQAEVKAIYSKRFTNTQQIYAGHVLADSSFPVDSSLNNTYFWHLNADSNDDSANSMNMTDVSGSTMTFDGYNIFGEVGAANLDGSNDCVSAADGFLDSHAWQALSVGAWVWTHKDAIGGTKSFISQWDNTANQRSFNLQRSASGNSFILSISSDGTTSVNTEVLSSDMNESHAGKWQHVVGVYENKRKSKVYVNGRLVSTSQEPVGPMFNSSADYAIGCAFSSTTPNAHWQGRIEQAFISSKALTAGDVRKLYAAKISHNKGFTDISSQNWSAFWRREDEKMGLPMDNGWIVDAYDANNIWVDFRLDPGSFVRIQSK